MNQNTSITIRMAGLVLALSLGAAAGMRAQETVASHCDSGWSSFSALGISGFTCDCSLNRKDTSTTWSFRGEPVISAITPGGPASGKLREGDVIVAIDGLLITTRAAGEKVGNLRGGENIILTVRRNGRVQEVGIRTEADCTDVTGVIAVRPPTAPARLSTTTPSPDRAPRPPRLASTTAPAIAALPTQPEPPMSAWFGFGISCHNCRVHAGGTWEFSEYPTIYSVDPESPADNAGLRRGDVLMKIDGADLLIADGARRFGNIDPGQTVTWSFRRGGTTRSVRVTAIQPPGRSADLGELRTLIKRLHVDQGRELSAETARLRAELADRELSLAGRSDLQGKLALVDSLRLSLSLGLDEHVARLNQTLAEVERGRADAAPALAGADAQHLRFAGMVGNTNVEVRGLSSVDVSYDNATGELLIKTMDSTIRVKAPNK